jgi:hypothetical protein
MDREILDMLLPGEEVLLVAEQSRIAPGGSLTTPNKIYVTNRRVVFRNPKLLGLKADINDYAYEDISNIRLHRGMFSTEIFLKPRFLSDQVALPAVDKDIAKKLSECIHKGMAKQLPGQVISERVTAPTVEKTIGTTDPVSELERLHNLKEKGAITAEEFETMKARILRLPPVISRTPQTPVRTPTSPATKYCTKCGNPLSPEGKSGKSSGLSGKWKST